MNRVSRALGALGRRNHLADERLYELAGPLGAAPATPVAPATPAEQAHLESCVRCGGLLVGFRRTEAVFAGAWVDRPVRSAAEASGRIETVGGVRVGRLSSARPAPRRQSRRWAAGLIAAATVIGVVAATGLLSLRGGSPAASGPLSTTPTPGMPATPQGTGVVARLPIGQYATFSWAPDGAHLLVSDPYGEGNSRVYDRFGKLVATFGPIEGWLDSGHLIGGDGYVADIYTNHSAGPTSNSRVVASGHGAAAIVVGIFACTCDPLVDWYRDGQYVRANEKVSPLGWSPDGRLLLRGHQPDTSQDAELNGWKGPVDITDFATGHVLATAPNVRGQTAFSPSGTRLAAQSDTDLEIVDIATGAIRTVTGARLLGWWTDDYVYYLATGNKIAVVPATVTTEILQGPAPTDWPIQSSKGPDLLADWKGSATRIVSSDHKTTLLDLSSASLVALRPGPWSPDGRMLALESSDGTSLVLISVDPSHAGAVGSALPTPIASASALGVSDRTALPGPVAQLVADAKRDSFWFLGGNSGGPVELYRYDVATAATTKHAIAGTTYKADRARLAIGPDGRLWVGAGQGIVVYDPDTDHQTSVSLPISGPDIQTDPKTGKADPWVAGIAFDGNGNALVARNWVRSLLRIDGSLTVLPDRIDVSDGFAMTGGLVFAGGMAYVTADAASGFGFGIDTTGKLYNTKFQAPAVAAVGDRVLAAGTPPMWIVPGSGDPTMIQPVMASADLVAGGPNGTCVLYDNATGQAQWRDKDGKVSLQAAFKSGTAPRVSTIALDAKGRLWAVEATGSTYALVRFSVGP